METRPFADAVLATVRPVRVKCPVTWELYGYCDPVLDVEASIAAFRKAYHKKAEGYGHKGNYLLPTREEVEHARQHFNRL